MNPWVTLGKIGAPFGLKGAAHVYSFTNPAENLLDYMVWHLGGREVCVESCRPHGKHFIAEIHGVKSVEQARQLTNLEIQIPRSELPELDPAFCYIQDLIGCQVQNLKGCNFGSVTDLMSTSANDVLVVGKHLIPYVKQYVLTTDLEQKIIVVDWELDY